MVPSFARHREVFDNGLRLVTVELPHLHTATIVMYARVGSRYEDARDNGLSHFLEHMLFRGTTRHPDAYRMNFAIESLGGTLYAETGRDYSLYQLGLHPESLTAGLEIFGELFHEPVFEGIDVERRIILEEILEDLDERGQDINVDDVSRALMFPDHPLGFKITGPYANVERFTSDDVRRHFGRCYGASNMILAVAGAVEHAALLPICRRATAAIPTGTLLTSPTPADTAAGPRYAYVRNPGSQTSVQILFRALPEHSADYPALLMLSRILDDGMSTRLHRRVCDELGLAYYVSASIDSFSDAALFEIDATTAHANAPALVRESLDLLTRLRDEPPGQDELDKARRRYRWDLESSFDETDAMAGWWGGTELYYPPLTFEEKVRRVEALTPADISRVAATIFRPERMVLCAVGQLDGGLDRKLRGLLDGFR